ncbi:GPW/gp25 family protein [Lentisphaerota bacterium WC36G]|nr:GPW/gp25 family protein [Lentisphaerae bacterium WC36]
MNGINNATGKTLTGIDHLKQSIADILNTPIGSRVMRPTYGSNIFKLIDNPVNETFKINIFAATAEALKKWEPRFKLSFIDLEMSELAGQFFLNMTGIYVPNGKEINLTGVKIL